MSMFSTKNCCRNINGFVTLISDDYGWYGNNGNFTPVVGQPYCSIDISHDFGQSISSSCFDTLRSYLCSIYSPPLRDKLLDDARDFMNQCLSTTVTLPNGEVISAPCNQIIYYDPTCDCYQNNPNYSMWQNKQSIMTEVQIPQNMQVCFANAGNQCSIRS